MSRYENLISEGLVISRSQPVYRSLACALSEELAGCPRGQLPPGHNVGGARSGRARLRWPQPSAKAVAAVEFRILGSVEADDGGPSKDLGGLRERTLLARLLLSAGQVV